MRARSRREQATRPVNLRACIYIDLEIMGLMEDLAEKLQASSTSEVVRRAMYAYDLADGRDEPVGYEPDIRFQVRLPSAVKEKITHEATKADASQSWIVAHAVRSFVRVQKEVADGAGGERRRKAA